jgi:protein-tyrosine-phosphatase
MVTVLFVCVHNSGRSQMAEAIFNRLSGGRHRGISAGSNPAEAVNPVVVEALREIGIDISGRRPRKLTAEIAEEADIAVTMGCGEGVCPIVPGEIRDWPLEDPTGKPVEAVRKIRDEIEARVKALLAELGP